MLKPFAYQSLSDILADSVWNQFQALSILYMAEYSYLAE